MWGVYLNGRLLDLYYYEDDAYWGYILAKLNYASAKIRLLKLPKNYLG